MASAADRGLLFGLLALRNGLINRGQLVAAFQAWTLDKSQRLADILLGRGDLNATQHDLLEALAGQHDQKQGDLEKSLAALPTGKFIRESLAGLAATDIEATLGHAGSAHPETHTYDVDLDRTTDYSFGSATSNGQRFRILRPHARGGLGEVFVAVDNELHRQVALKQILEKHADDPISRERFIAEAEITGALEHPGRGPGLRPGGARSREQKRLACRPKRWA
jgi:hypothetical protein